MLWASESWGKEGCTVQAQWYWLFEMFINAFEFFLVISRFKLFHEPEKTRSYEKRHVERGGFKTWWQNWIQAGLELTSSSPQIFQGLNSNTNLSLQLWSNSCRNLTNFCPNYLKYAISGNITKCCQYICSKKKIARKLPNFPRLSKCKYKKPSKSLQWFIEAQ